MRAWIRRLRVVIGIGLALALAPAGANAQQALRAPDGQMLESQSERTQQVFRAMYGPGCAAQEWLWQHTLAIDDAFVDGPAASDGQHLADQDDDVQLVFVAVWGTSAPSEWVAEHNAVVSRHVLPAPVAPIPCPAARVINAEAISTAALLDAVESAKAANLPEAHGNLNRFRDLWTTTRADIRKTSPAVADAVQEAYDQAAAVISDPRAPTPTQSQYLPVLENLLDVVRNANVVLAGGGETAPARGDGGGATEEPDKLP